MSDRIWTPTSTLGDIADALRPMKDGGMTRDSMLFVIDKVWFEEAQEEADRTEAALAYVDHLTADNARLQEETGETPDPRAVIIGGVVYDGEEGL